LPGGTTISMTNNFPPSVIPFLQFLKSLHILHQFQSWIICFIM
jgi:hypothetical protein